MPDGIRTATPEDAARIRELNESEVPHVGRFRGHPTETPVAPETIYLVAIHHGELAGFLLAMTPEADYDSPNFLWFRERARDYLYVDRIAVAGTARGAGIGRRLYAKAAATAPKGLVRIGCEVNIRPPNPASLAFHRAIGFREVGRRAFVPGEKEVVYLECACAQLAAGA
jgi:predicted GNAT superfamily acetyltransferase